MENRRFILLSLLGVVLFFMYQAWQEDYGQSLEPAATVQPAPNSGVIDDAPVLSATDSKAEQPTAPVPVAAIIVVETDVMRAEISARGGEVQRLELKGYPASKQQPNQPLALLDNREGRWFVLQSGLAASPAPLSSSQTLFHAAQTSYSLAPGADSLDVMLESVTETGQPLRKQFRFHRNSYEIDLTQSLTNISAAELKVTPYVRYQRIPYVLGVEPKFASTFSGIGVYEQKPDGGGYRFRKETFEDLQKEPVELKQTGGWLTMLQHYFIVAIIPPAEEALILSGEPGKERGYKAQYLGATQVVPAGGEHSFTTQLYIGPKLQARIGEVAPGLELTLDYGILTALAKPLFWVLHKFHGLTGNWGWAIILLTLVVKLALFKLSEAQYRSMAKMKKFAPKIQELKDRYGEDRERMQKAMMELYKKEGFNPLAGCWPLLVQMPVFLALFWVLQESVELRQAPFELWINDLSAADPYFVLPVLFGASMWFQQKLSGQQMADPMQQKMMNIMPIMLTAFFAFFQAGLVLYWLVSNLIGIGQQWVITKRLEKMDLKR